MLTNSAHSLPGHGICAHGSPDGKQSVPPTPEELQVHKRCFTAVFCEAVVSLQSSRPIRTEAWLSQTC